MNASYLAYGEDDCAKTFSSAVSCEAVDEQWAWGASVSACVEIEIVINLNINKVEVF